MVSDGHDQLHDTTARTDSHDDDDKNDGDDDHDEDGDHHDGGTKLIMNKKAYHYDPLRNTIQLLRKWILNLLSRSNFQFLTEQKYQLQLVMVEILLNTLDLLQVVGKNEKYSPDGWSNDDLPW